MAESKKAPADIEAICNQLAEGKSLRAIAKEMGKAESTLRYWIAKDPEAFAHSARAKELGCDSLADECLEISDNPDIDPADKRIMIDTRVRLIGKWSQRYGDKVAHEHTGKDGSPIQTETKLDYGALSVEQLRALASVPVPTE